jgi:Fanconi anemia group J protein
MGRRDSQGEGATPPSSEVVQMCLWTLNPAIAFRNLAQRAHSLILTSGTLAPMDTFASEVCFPVMLRLWVADSNNQG